MTFEAALISELAAAIPALGGRIYPVSAPEANRNGGTPYAIVVSSEGLRDKTLDGYMDSKSVPGEINIIAPSYSTVRAITKQVVALLIGMEQRTIGSDGPFIEELTYEQPVELYEEKPDMYRCLVEFTAYFDEEGSNP